MYLSNNYVDINIYPLTMNVMCLWACLYGKGAISNDNIIIIINIIIILKCVWSLDPDPKILEIKSIFAANSQNIFSNPDVHARLWDFLIFLNFAFVTFMP